jgi:hypothetical protein
MHNEGIWVPIIMFLTIGATTVLFPIARAYARRLDRGAGQAAVPPEVASRLERMEQAIDSIAIEVERISEGQRFTTKLLAERGGAGEPARMTRGEPDRV